MTILRPYQQKLLHDTRQAWASGARNVVKVLPTGGGKTVCLSTLLLEHQGASAVIAHRAELVVQLSLALARQGVRHRIIAAQTTVRAAIDEHMATLGQSFYDPGARCAVCSIDTLVRADGLASWAAQVTFWVTDEGHHVVEDNKWHKGIGLFQHPDVRGLLPTASPERADGKGLGRAPVGSGIADAMVFGPTPRALIEDGYLTDYRVVCPQSDLEILADVAASGDWSPKALKEAAQKSHIVGDAVAHYLRWAPGRLGITFSTDVETAQATAKAFRDAGVMAETLTGKTEPGLRRQILRRYERREVQQLVAVDIVSEGFDLPAIEVESSCRPTKSWQVWVQQVGRMMRPVYAAGFDLDTRAGRLAAIAAGPKPKGLLIDHVGNFARPELGPPDRPRAYTLADRDRKSSAAPRVPYRTCLNVECVQPYERIEPVCPFCGTPPPEPAGRSLPSQVDGDLYELDADVLARLRGEVVDIDRASGDILIDLMGRGVPPQYQVAQLHHVEATQAAQRALRDAMGRFGGPRHAAGKSDRNIQREFFFLFGLSTVEALGLRRKEAEDLTARIEAQL